jgi:hypothetical protein
MKQLILFSLFFISTNGINAQTNCDSIITALRSKISLLEVKSTTTPIFSHSDSLKQLMLNYFHAKSFDEKITYVTEPQKFKQILIDYSGDFSSKNDYNIDDLEVLNNLEVLNKKNTTTYYIAKTNEHYLINILRSIGYNEYSFSEFKNDDDIKKGTFNLKVKLYKNNDGDFKDLDQVFINSNYPDEFSTAFFDKNTQQELYNLVKSGKEIKVQLELKRMRRTFELDNFQKKYNPNAEKRTEDFLLITKLINSTW